MHMSQTFLIFSQGKYQLVSQKTIDVSYFVMFDIIILICSHMCVKFIFL